MTGREPTGLGAGREATFFSEPERFSDLDAYAIGTMIATASDVAFVVTEDGVIQDLSVGGDSVDLASLRQWRGATLGDLITEESRPKLTELLSGAVRGEAPQWREINHVAADGSALPVRYAAIRTGEAGHIVLLGRDLRAVSRLQGRLVKAQMALEQDYERFRQIETRYRVLFETTQEALIVLDAETGRIVDVNPPAARRLGRETRELNGSILASEFDGASHRGLSSTLASVRATGQPRNVTLTSRDGRTRIELRCILFRAARDTLVLCRLAAPDTAPAPEGSEADQALRQLVDKAPDAVVITDGTGIIRSA
ncbi:MAG: PAS domain-containing protein, partial [Pseudomonadota bacterium]